MELSKNTGEMFYVEATWDPIDTNQVKTKDVAQQPRNHRIAQTINYLNYNFPSMEVEKAHFSLKYSIP